ncbi:MAG: hypothetical protein PHV37_05030 [Candidatus Gastranaerophilales bacterium]|nr:hypothetical protein [Candidatus Gastranaerophilales bacterium]
MKINAVDQNNVFGPFQPNRNENNKHFQSTPIASQHIESDSFISEKKAQTAKNIVVIGSIAALVTAGLMILKGKPDKLAKQADDVMSSFSKSADDIVEDIMV